MKKGLLTLAIFCAVAVWFTPKVFAGEAEAASVPVDSSSSSITSEGGASSQLESGFSSSITSESGVSSQVESSSSSSITSEGGASSQLESGFSSSITSESGVSSQVESSSSSSITSEGGASSQVESGSSSSITSEGGTSSQVESGSSSSITSEGGTSSQAESSSSTSGSAGGASSLSDDVLLENSSSDAIEENGVLAVEESAALNATPQASTPGCWEVVNFGDYSAQVFIDANGNRVTGPQTIDGINYFFYANGALAWGGESIWNNKTYLVQDGKIYSGWKEKDFGGYKADTYYDPNQLGAMSQKQVVSVGDALYAFYENGAQVWQNLLYWEKVYLVENGRVVTGWRPVNYGDYSANAYFNPDENGAAMTGVSTIDDKKYYFYSNGAQAWGGTYQEDGKLYYVESGKIKTGWVTRDFGEYKANSYADPTTGAIKIGFTEIEGKKYYFFDNGAQAWQGFFDVQGETYAVKNGTTATGWIVRDYGSYKANTYFDPLTGVMKKGFVPIDGKYYYFFDNGAQAWGSGITQINNKTYFLVNGNLQVGWIVRDFGTYSAKSYFSVEDGVMVTGFQGIDGKHYLFFDNGAQAWGNNGPSQIGSNIYYIVNGEAKVGWIAQDFGSYSADTYYDPTTGTRQTGFNKIGDKHYLFFDNGALAWGNNGITLINGSTYYIVNGVAHVGWIARDFGAYWGDSYFFPSNGIMAIACNKIENRYYFFFDNGARAWGEGVVSKGSKNYYVKDGFVVTNTTVTIGGKTYQAVEDGELLDLLRGVDVSAYQGIINWTAVKNSGIQFAVVRAMSWPAGSSYYQMDPYFVTNIKNARAAGLYVGAYWFSYAFNGGEAIEEVTFINNSNEWKELKNSGIILDLPFFIDYEYSDQRHGEYMTANTTYDSRTEAVRTGMVHTENLLGCRPGFYGSYNDVTKWYNGIGLINEGYDCWVAQWGSTNSLGAQANMWQYTSSGTVPGINGNVDLNLCYNKDYFDSIKVYDQGLKKNVQGNAEIIIARIVQNEVGGMNNTEVYKAQAIASNTYIRHLLAQGKTPSVKLSPGVPSSAIRGAVHQVKNERVYYNGALALTVYTASSAPVTNSAGNYGWGYVPYLVGVSNPWDAMVQSEYVDRTCYVTNENLKKGIEALGGSTAGYSPDKWIQTVTTDGRWVLSVKMCGKTYTAEQFYNNTWGLYSTNFGIFSYDAARSRWAFYGVNGYGHGIGMSQWGALGMAKAGYNYKEILQHYYRGTTVS